MVDAVPGMTLSLFGWCSSGDHTNCRRKVRGFTYEGKKLVWRDIIYYCSCDNKKCECFKQEKVPFSKSIVNVELPNG
jgi:hypothetical protein